MTRKLTASKEVKEQREQQRQEKITQDRKRNNKSDGKKGNKLWWKRFGCYESHKEKRNVASLEITNRNYAAAKTLLPNTPGVFRFATSFLCLPEETFFKTRKRNASQIIKVRHHPPKTGRQYKKVPKHNFWTLGWKGAFDESGKEVDKGGACLPKFFKRNEGNQTKPGCRRTKLECKRALDDRVRKACRMHRRDVITDPCPQSTPKLITWDGDRWTSVARRSENRGRRRHFLTPSKPENSATTPPSQLPGCILPPSSFSAPHFIADVRDPATLWPNGMLEELAVQELTPAASGAGRLRQKRTASPWRDICIACHCMKTFLPFLFFPKSRRKLKRHPW